MAAAAWKSCKHKLDGSRPNRVARLRRLLAESKQHLQTHIDERHPTFRPSSAGERIAALNIEWWKAIADWW